MKKWILASLTLATFGCATISKDVQLTHEGKPEAELVVYRVSSFNAGGEGLYFGENGKSFSVLDNGEYMRTKIDAGIHKFEAKAHASGTFELSVNLAEGQTTCIKAYADPANAAVLLVPILGNVKAHFKLEQVGCPGEEFFREFRLVK